MQRKTKREKQKEISRFETLDRRETMVPRTKEELRQLVSETTIEMYEEMTPQLIKLIDETKKDNSLTEAQKQDEISLHFMGYTKACTNEIIIEVLSQILNLE